MNDEWIAVLVNQFLLVDYNLESMTNVEISQILCFWVEDANET